MTDLWTEAAAGVEADQLNREFEAVRTAAEDIWSFLAQSSSGTDYTNRKALVKDQIDAALAGVTQKRKVRKRLLASFDKAVGKHIAANRKTARPKYENSGSKGYGNVVRDSRDSSAFIAEVDFEDGSYLAEDFDDLDEAKRWVDSHVASVAKGASQNFLEQFADYLGRDVLRRFRSDLEESFDDTGFHSDASKWVQQATSREDALARLMALVDFDWYADWDQWEAHREIEEEAGMVDPPANLLQEAEDIWRRHIGSKKRAVTDFGPPLSEYTDAELGELHATRKTAGIYCKTHNVWVGEGNEDTHEGCSKEQRATEKTKDARRRHAEYADPVEYWSVECAKCGAEGEAGDLANANGRCRLCGTGVLVDGLGDPIPVGLTSNKKRKAQVDDYYLLVSRDADNQWWAAIPPPGGGDPDYNGPFGSREEAVAEVKSHLEAYQADDALGRGFAKKASERYEEAKKVVESGQAGEIEGHTLDTTSAKALVAGYEALSPENQAKFDAPPLDQLMKVIWKNVARKAASIKKAVQITDVQDAWATVDNVLRNGRVEDVQVGGKSSDTRVVFALPMEEYHFTHFDNLGWHWASKSVYGKGSGVFGAGTNAQGFIITDPDHIQILDRALSSKTGSRKTAMTEAEAIDYLNQRGGSVPASRWGRHSKDIAPAAYAVATIMAGEHGEEVDEDTLDYVMGLMVNDHDDPEYILREYGPSYGYNVEDYL